MRYTAIGGRLLGDLDLTIEGQLPVSVEKYADNIRRAAEMAVPEIERASLRGRRIALVAGGPSIDAHVETLKAWDGEIWAVNGAYRWCMDRGIEATLIAIDPDRIVLNWAEGAHKAILGNTCDPDVFEMLKGADVRLVRLAADGIKGTSSTATIVPHLAAYVAAAGATFFGCESSFTGASHAYQRRLDALIAAGLHIDRDDHVVIACADGDHLTVPDFLRQAVELSRAIREFPGYLAEESGGLLRALVKDPEHHIKWISEAYGKALIPIRKPAPTSPVYPPKVVDAELVPSPRSTLPMPSAA